MAIDKNGLAINRRLPKPGLIDHAVMVLKGYALEVQRQFAALLCSAS